ncbi:MAG TPA: TonB family protein [Sumerlaeia bacterium]|nr:TonB family protein [Sumerlaeia bacterium]
MVLFPRKHFGYPISRSFYYSTVGHVCAVLVIAILSLLSPTVQRPKRVIVAPGNLVVHTPEVPREQESPKEEEAPKVEETKPTPVTSPPPVKPVAIEDVVIKPLPTPRSVVKTVAVAKEKMPTPRPTPEPAPTPKPKPTVQPKKQPRQARTTPTPAPAPRKAKAAEPSPSPQRTTLPRVSQATPSLPFAPGSIQPPTLQTEENVTLPFEYLADAHRKLQENFRVPRHLLSPTSCVVRFRVKRDGTITDVQVKESSGSAARDARAVQAVKDAAAFLPLPDDVSLPYITVSAPFVFDGE